MTTVAQPSYRQRVGYHSALLGGIALMASAVLVITDMQTRDTIAERQAEDFRQTLEQVLPAALHDNQPQQDTYQLQRADGRTLEVYRARQEGRVSAVAFQMTGRGYAGPIDILMGVDADGEVLGVRVLRHKETPGLGDKIEVARDPWILSFGGLSLGEPPREDWAVKKDGGIFDQFTGATITPRVVVNAVRDGLEVFEQHRSTLLQRGDESASSALPPTPLPLTGEGLMTHQSPQTTPTHSPFSPPGRRAGDEGLMVSRAMQIDNTHSPFSPLGRRAGDEGSGGHPAPDLHTTQEPTP
ncbi:MULTISPECIES: electron transport complex subunit RsxG [unclassified Ectothiorhodospira]|uniref:electron transport complex subunit RsxG n=1 Tax=unclassified Ectothiorhodospira TaxID=2684909 RepID=UPI001EE8B543|nr:MULTISPECIES: electron transport complex subunit RsxG [unclassified Ectothiorhodospira]MCG5515034.1 electron transport complex subunit RsxG [Ectothiorhodospira sp. 9100]MCG5517643.1 electron transport complex subunit RsxG [Ectothiorhodospira sp. 9905]